ncbi:hypothetical protein [Gracilinema caldarium]|uniref:hypothetical protein n=1 Tax=Gracilinema caldarium TaxID=215591 RepID=UPI0026EE9F35|nr:hypothetical protein [Gracilinema caldarium]
MYSRKIGNKQDELIYTSRFVNEEKGSYFELSSSAPDQKALYRIDAASLLATYTDVTTYGEDATVNRVSRLLETRYKAKEGELLVSSTDTLGQSLRLFPWGKQQKAKIIFIGTGASVGGFTFELTVTGKEKLTIMGREVECWKAQLGLSGIFGSLVGKTSLWFLASYPYYMVKSEGVSGPPGTPKSSLELIRYEN